MRHIQAIVVFNSATAGDFVTGLCWSQLNINNKINLEQSGRMVISNAYFKSITSQMYHNPDQDLQFDYNKIFSVENSHYWLECYPAMAKQLVFIDYPEHIQSDIMQIYLEKVYDNDKQKMLDVNLPHQHPYIAQRISVENIVKILNIQWLKNIKAWRKNCHLQPIQLADFFDKSKMQNTVKMLIGQNITDQSKFDQVYNSWRQRNTRLEKLF